MAIRVRCGEPELPALDLEVNAGVDVFGHRDAILDVVCRGSRAAGEQSLAEELLRVVIRGDDRPHPITSMWEGEDEKLFCLQRMTATIRRGLDRSKPGGRHGAARQV